MANTELLKKIKTLITIERSGNWDQSLWGKTSPDNVDENGDLKEITCGTEFCVAGWACVLSGEKIDWRGAEMMYDGNLQASRLVNGQEIEARAAELLDLDEHSATELFYGLGHEGTLNRLDELIEHGYLESDF